jgi:putative transposase
MKKTKFTEEQMIGAVKQLEPGRSAKDLARELGVTDQTLCNWRARYSGMDVNEARRLRALEDENRRLKTMVADLSLDREALKGVIRKKRLELVSTRRDVAFLMAEFRYSERQVCKLLDVDRSSYRRRIGQVAVSSLEYGQEELRVRRQSARWHHPVSIKTPAVHS